MTHKRDPTLHFARMTLAGASIRFDPYPRPLRHDFAAVRGMLWGVGLTLAAFVVSVRHLIGGG